jgi:hypothetical protein
MFLVPLHLLTVRQLKGGKGVVRAKASDESSLSHNRILVVYSSWETLTSYVCACVYGVRARVISNGDGTGGSNK